MLARAGEAFPEGRAMAGAAPGPSPPQARTERAIDELLGNAAPVATAFGAGMLTVGGTSLINALGGFGEIHNLAAQIGGRLRHGFRHWGGVIAKRVKRWAPLAIALGGFGPGSAAVAGANGAGLIYSLLSLADRLDTVPGWVPGVPTILEQNLGPRTAPRPAPGHHII